MPRKPKPPRDDPEESKRFIDMAREVEADESKDALDALDRAFKKVVHKPDTLSHPSGKRSKNPSA